MAKGNPPIDSVALLRRVAVLEQRVAELEHQQRSTAPPPVAGPWNTDESDAALAELVSPDEEQAADHEIEGGIFAPPPMPVSSTGEMAGSTVAYASPPAAHRVDEGTLEQKLGLQWAGWIGAIVVAIGAMLGVKWLYDVGWIGGLPAVVRLAAMAIGGLGFLGAGEFVLRRGNPRGAVGLLATGIAVLFVVCYSGHAVLEVYARPAAFALMALVSLGGAAVSVRGRFVSVAVVAILGGHLTPVVLGGSATSLAAVLTYVAMLQATALGLAWWGRTRRWRMLRWLAFGASAVWVGGFLLTRASDVPLALVLVMAGLLLLEVALTAGWPRRLAKAARTGLPRPRERLATDLALIMLVTAGLVVATLIRFREADPWLRATWIVGYAGAYLAIGSVLRRRRRARALSGGMLVLAATLLAVAVPVAVQGPAVALTWAGLAIGFAVVARRGGGDLARLAAVLTWAAGIIYVPVGVRFGYFPTAPDLAIAVGGFELANWAMVYLLLGIAGHVLATLIFDGVSRWSSIARGASVAGAVLLGVAGLGGLAGVPSATLLVACGLGLWLADRVQPRLVLTLQAVVLLGVAVVDWAAVDLMAARLSVDWAGPQRELFPVVNAMMMPGAVLIAGIATLVISGRARLVAGLDGRASARGWAAAGVALLALAVTVALSVELERVVTSPGQSTQETWRTLALGLTVLWLLMTASTTACLTTLLLAGRDRAVRVVSTIGGVLGLLIAAKFALFDKLPFHFTAVGAQGYPLLTIESAVGLLVIAVLLTGWWRFGRAGPERASVIATSLGGGALVLGAWLGLYEVARAVTLAGGGSLAFQVCVSMWLGTYAAACVGAGFYTRRPALRWFGLVLLGFVLLKVLLLDLGTLGKGWRTLSFVATGVLLLLVSVLYGKFSPKADANEPAGA